MTDDELRRQQLELVAGEECAKKKTGGLAYELLGVASGILAFITLQVLAFARMPANPTAAHIGWRVGSFVGGIVGILIYVLWRIARCISKRGASQKCSHIGPT